MNLDPIIFAWGVSPYYGWGVVGINFMLNWPGAALSAMPDLSGVLPGSDPRAELLADRIAMSKEWAAGINFGIATETNLPVLMGLGNDLRGIPLSGMPTVAFPVFEDVAVVRAAIDRLLAYDCVITSSQWNHDVLADFGISSKMVHQGYDPVLFHPVIRKPRTRFRVFSGGKAEHRKGQDLVLQGFKIFAETHDDAVLHAAWHSPWPQLADTFELTEVGSPPRAPGGTPNFAAWAQRAGIKRHQFVSIPATPNYLMPDILADMDCAVFASRLEGGTNIAAMECLGCGIPTILSWTTGHKDLPHNWSLTELTPEAIADALRGAYDDNRAWRQGWPRRDEIDEFAWPKRIADLVSVLENV